MSPHHLKQVVVVVMFHFNISKLECYVSHGPIFKINVVPESSLVVHLEFPVGGVR